MSIFDERKKRRNEELEKMRGSGKVQQVVKELEPNKKVQSLVARMVKLLGEQKVTSPASHIVNAGKNKSKGQGFER